MTTTHTQLQWVTTLGWARTHLLAASGFGTRCGLWIPHETTITHSNQPHCRTCQRTLT